MDVESLEMGRARLKAKTTRTMPTSMRVGMLIMVSMSQRTLKPVDEPMQEEGNEDHLSTKVRAESMRWGWCVTVGHHGRRPHYRHALAG